MNKREVIRYINHNISQSNIMPPEVRPFIAHYLIQRAIDFNLDDKTIESDVKSITTFLRRVEIANSSKYGRAGSTTTGLTTYPDRDWKVDIILFADKMNEYDYSTGKMKEFSPQRIYEILGHELDHALHYLAEKIDENDKPGYNNFDTTNNATHSKDVEEYGSFHEHIVERIASTIVYGPNKQNPYYNTSYWGYRDLGMSLEMFLAAFGLGEYECLQKSMKSKNVLKRYISSKTPFSFSEIDDRFNSFEHFYNYLHKVTHGDDPNYPLKNAGKDLQTGFVGLINVSEDQIGAEIIRTDFLRKPEAIEMMCYRQNRLQVTTDAFISDLVGTGWFPDFMKSDVFHETERRYKSVSEKLYYLREAINHRKEIEADIGSSDFELFFKKFQAGSLYDAFYALTKNRNVDEASRKKIYETSPIEQMNVIKEHLENTYGIKPISEDYHLEVSRETIQKAKQMDNIPPITLGEKISNSIAIMKFYAFFNNERKKLGYKSSISDFPLFKFFKNFRNNENIKVLMAPGGKFQDFNYRRYLSNESMKPEKIDEYILEKLNSIRFQTPELRNAFLEVMHERMDNRDSSIVEIENELSNLATRIQEVRYSNQKPMGYNQDRAVSYDYGCVNINIPNAKKLNNPEELRDELIGVVNNIIDIQKQDFYRANDFRYAGFYTYMNNLHGKFDTARMHQKELVELDDVEEKLGAVQNVLKYGFPYNDMTQALLAAKCGNESLSSSIYNGTMKMTRFDVERYAAAGDLLYDSMSRTDLDEQTKAECMIRGSNFLIDTYASLGRYGVAEQLGKSGKDFNTFFEMQKCLVDGLRTIGADFSNSPMVNTSMNMLYENIFRQNEGNMCLIQLLSSEEFKSTIFDVDTFVKDKNNTDETLPWRLCLRTLLINNSSPVIIDEIKNLPLDELKRRTKGLMSQHGIPIPTAATLKERVEAINYTIPIERSPRFNHFYRARDLKETSKNAENGTFDRIFNEIDALFGQVDYNLDGNGEPQHATTYANGLRPPTEDDLVNPTLRSADSLPNRDE